MFPFTGADTPQTVLRKRGDMIEAQAGWPVLSLLTRPPSSGRQARHYGEGAVLSFGGSRASGCATADAEQIILAEALW